MTEMVNPSLKRDVGCQSVDIVFLDQNKWIELARVEAGKVTTGPIATLYSQLVTAVEEHRVLFPLAISHILETSKRNDPVSRGWVVETQAKLSRGYVYRSRAGRLLVEIRTTLQRLLGAKSPDLPKNWAIAHGFMQAFEPMDTLLASAPEADRTSRLNRHVDPRDQYIDYMKNQDDSRRRAAHVKLAMGTSELVARIEARRALLTGNSVDLRRRAYSARLFLDHQDDMIKVLHGLGYSFEQLRALGDKAVIALIEDVPTLNVEAEMAARLEAKTGDIHPNDVFDIQSLYTAIPYSTRIVAEKGAISRAKQAKLDVRYQVSLSQSLTDLIGVYL